MTESATEVPACPVVAAEPAGPVDLGWTLATVLRAFVRGADAVLDGLPGGARAVRLLMAVDREAPPTQLVLAQQAGLDRTVVTYLLDDLAGAGLIERRPDPADRRARLVVLTPAGCARLRECRSVLATVEQHVLAALHPAEAAELRRLLDAVAESVQHNDPTTCEHVVALSGPPPD